MKRMLFVLALASFSLFRLSAQAEEDRNFRIPLIGEPAPSFTAETTNGTINFPGDYGKKWKILFSHPADFTPVCSTELLELAYLQKEFDALGVKLAVISTDPLETHLDWKKALENVDFKGRPAQKIKFPLIDDNSREVSKKYGMIHSATNTTKDVRGIFIIGPDNIIQSIHFYPMSVGRNTEEIIRTINALQATAENKNSMTPADWKAGNDLMISAPPVTDQQTANVPDGFYKLSWFMWYEKAKSSK